jgi:hypothetical protein
VTSVRDLPTSPAWFSGWNSIFRTNRLRAFQNLNARSYRAVPRSTQHSGYKESWTHRPLVTRKQVEPIRQRAATQTCQRHLVRHVLNRSNDACSEFV